MESRHGKHCLAKTKETRQLALQMTRNLAYQEKIHPGRRLPN